MPPGSGPDAARSRPRANSTGWSASVPCSAPSSPASAKCRSASSSSPRSTNTSASTSANRSRSRGTRLGGDRVDSHVAPRGGDQLCLQPGAERWVRAALERHREHRDRVDLCRPAAPSAAASVVATCGDPVTASAISRCPSARDRGSRPRRSRAHPGRSGRQATTRRRHVATPRPTWPAAVADQYSRRRHAVQRGCSLQAIQPSRPATRPTSGDNSRPRPRGRAPTGRRGIEASSTRTAQATPRGASRRPPRRRRPQERAQSSRTSSGELRHPRPSWHSRSAPCPSRRSATDARITRRCRLPTRPPPTVHPRARRAASASGGRRTSVDQHPKRSASSRRAEPPVATENVGKCTSSPHHQQLLLHRPHPHHQLQPRERHRTDRPRATQRQLARNAHGVEPSSSPPWARSTPNPSRRARTPRSARRLPIPPGPSAAAPAPAPSDRREHRRRSPAQPRARSSPERSSLRRRRERLRPYDPDR